MSETIMKSDAERMILEWQSECVEFPALYNQGNVLLERLSSLKPSLAMTDFLIGMNSLHASISLEDLKVDLANSYADAASAATELQTVRRKYAELIKVLKEGRRAIGDHSAPNDCYATGPMTGDAYRDLVQCPACSFIGMYDAVVANIAARSASPSTPEQER